MQEESRSSGFPWPAPLVEFMKLEAAGGIVLVAAAALALVLANSPLGNAYLALLDTRLAVGAGGIRIAKPVILWINDGLMAVFFLVVGLELKRELLEGHLSSFRRAILPVFAAAGGMLAPAVIYAVLNAGNPAALRGWAIPTATDIAFALGVLALLGPRVPTALKAFLLSVAIFDDLGAVIVIAAFYTEKISLAALAVAAGLLLPLLALNRMGVRRLVPYLLLGVPLWVAVLKSGVHATVAGVIIALFVPLRAEDPGTGRKGSSPLRRLEHLLHPWVAFGILPIFALANAGVPLAGLSPRDILHPVPLGIAGGLVLGKQVGILAASWLAVRLGLAALPERTGWAVLHGTAILCGIGFTMSLFIASLAFPPGAGGFDGLERLGILLGSLLSGLGGYALLRFVLPAAAGDTVSTGEQELSPGAGSGKQETS